MANEGSSGVSTKVLLSRIPTWFLAGGVLGVLPGAFLFISDVLTGQHDSVTGMMGPAFLVLAYVGGFAGGVLGLVIGVIVEWYRKKRTPQG